jgi:ABC-type antimicrobial peptide transport system permease subunit
MDDLARQRALVILMGAFATIAAILSALGMYGVIAYGVTQRRAELGVRMALGAGARVVVRTVVLRGLALCAVGGSIGLLAAALASRLLSWLLYGVGPFDAPTFALVGTALVCLAVIASGIPAFRASRVDPIEAVRGR